ncbi:hypothetical protein IFM89_033065 [Coptis chinensis]|uniref:non-specific serine/threonine protein kinase n=1 Tax=Coptis chinensis TaxID=261450 RepID=A0A835IFH8_9MAGN|nr:hypothetical protein IFM89_033065 [Coptis chinensis]
MIASVKIEIATLGLPSGICPLVLTVTGSGNGDDVKEKKPDPSIYLTAAKHYELAWKLVNKEQRAAAFTSINRRQRKATHPQTNMAGEDTLVWELEASRSPTAEGKDVVPWDARVNIITGIAKAMNHLHEKDIIYRDMKSENVLLDNNLKPLLTDFGGVCHLDAPTTLVAYSAFYRDPAYDHPWIPNKAHDVYSFGIFVLEVVSGVRPGQGLQSSGTLVQKLDSTSTVGAKTLLDPALGDDYVEDSLKLMVNLARQCVKTGVNERLGMAQVVAILTDPMELEAA